MKQAKKTRSLKGAILLATAAVAIAGAIYVIESGHWREVHAFFVQFHQRILWAATVLVFAPVLVVLLVRAWGVEDIPYVVEVPELGTGRFRRLASRLSQSRRSVFDQAYLTNELSELATQVIALNEGIDAAAARRLCRSGGWDGDPMILDLIRQRRFPDLEDRNFIAQLETVLDSIERMLTGGADGESRSSR
jgi:hypothetical protein